MIVCKFGGSSLSDATRIRQMAQIVRADAARRFVVVSAPGRRWEGDEKVTDLLLRAARGDEEALRATCSRFAAIAAQLQVPFEREIRDFAREVIGRDEAFAMSRGEYLCALLTARFLKSTFVDAAEIIAFGQDGAPDMRATYERTLLRLKPLAHAVIPGFYGATPAGEIRTFSRGGSDITGALLAGAMGARLYENWTDVDGFMSADPRLVQGTVCVPQISYRQMRMLSAMGAQILHPDSLLPVARAGIPTLLKNSFHPEHPGTLICADAWAQTPCITSRALKNGQGVLAVLSPEAMELPAQALAALRGADIRPVCLCAYADHLLLRVKASSLTPGVRALHRALVEKP